MFLLSVFIITAVLLNIFMDDFFRVFLNLSTVTCKSLLHYLLQINTNLIMTNYTSLERSKTPK